jgi:hypothetical protein
MSAGEMPVKQGRAGWVATPHCAWRPAQLFRAIDDKPLSLSEICFRLSSFNPQGDSNAECLHP